MAKSPVQSPYLFVYGSLRRGAKSGMNRLLAPCGRFVANAAFRGRLYRVAGYPGVVPSDQPGETVHGEVWRLDEPDAALARLDDYEECGADFPEPHEFVRRNLEVTLAGGEVVRAWLYLYNRPTDDLEIIGHGDFLRHEAGNETRGSD